MYTIIRFVFCIVVFAAVFFLCRPARQWFLNLDKRWKLLLFVICCGFLPLFLLSVSPESYFVNFSSPESAYGYLNGGTYSGIVYGKDSAIAVKTTGEGAVTTTLLHGSGTKWRISKPSQGAFTGVAEFGEICLDRLALDEIAGSYWSLMDIWGEIEADSLVALNGIAAAYQTSTTFAATGSEGHYWFFYLEDVPTTVELTVDGVPLGTVTVEE